MSFTEIRTTSAEGKPLYARLSGDGNSVLVLLHGFPESSGLWREVIPLLEDKYRLLAVDLPGAGQSLLPDAPLSVETMADAVDALIVAAGINEKIVLAGHSMGGYAAVAFAEKYGEKLAGLSLVHSTAGDDDSEKKAARQKVIRLLQNGGKETFIREMVPALFAPEFREAHPEVIAAQVSRARQLPVESMVAFYEAMILRPDRTTLLSQPGLPVQFHLGRHDSTIPLEKALPQALLPDVSFVEVYEGAAHMTMLEAPNLLAQNLASFVDYCFQNR